MTVAIGSDHAGFELKERLKEVLEDSGIHVKDYGTDSSESVDYPDFAIQVSRSVANAEHERGILICNTGIGMTIVANKIPGIRAALCMNIDMAEMSRRHNDANILVFGAAYTDVNLAMDMIRIFLDTTPDDAERHRRRVHKIHEITKR